MRSTLTGARAHQGTFEQCGVWRREDNRIRRRWRSERARELRWESQPESARRRDAVVDDPCLDELSHAPALVSLRKRYTMTVSTGALVDTPILSADRSKSTPPRSPGQ